DRRELLLVARERTGNESCSQFNSQNTRIDWRQIVDDAAFLLRTKICGGRELPLSEAVDPVIFNDVDQGQIPAHKMNELADTDRGSIAVATDADCLEGAIRQHRSGRNRRHAAVNSVEPMRSAQEVCWSLARAADSRKLHDAVGILSHLP